MIKEKILCILLVFAALYSCMGQTNNNTMTKDSTNNPLICDPVEGICAMPDNSAAQEVSVQKIDKPVKIIYFTDPICSSCWGIEPQLRKLKLEYGDHIEIEYRMGGLLPDWSYNSGGISKPSDVAHHWDEVSVYYDMPIDGEVWLEDPLHSSYPPSIAFKAAQLQNNEKAILLMRELREMVFLQKKNIAKWEQIASAAKRVGLDVNKLKTDFEGQARSLFEEDLKLAKEYGVRGFPTMFFINDEGRKEIVYGSKPYSSYENSLLSLFPKAEKRDYKKDWETLFTNYNSLTAKEFSELSNTPRINAEKVLDELVVKGQLEKLTTKNGSIWTIIKKNR